MVLLTAAIAAACVALFGYAMAMRAAMARRARLARLALAGEPGAGPGAAAFSIGPDPALRKSRFGVSGPLTRLLSRAASMQWLAEQLERAAWRLTVTEFLLVAIGSGMLFALVGSARVRVLAVPLGLFGLYLPLLVLRVAVSRRRKKFVKQLVEMLPLVANALKVGVALMQALDQASEQLKAPMSDELRRVIRDVRLGATPDIAFSALNDRIKDRDLDLVVSAILIQRSTGGNLAEILDGVAHTMRERIRIRGEIKTLTTQQQFSGYILALLPAGLLAGLTAINRDYMGPLFSTTGGRITLAICAAAQILGFFIIRKIVNIEV
ncbi:MAG TPA: type II secretion system F family protein [Dehalococcoidia bacterium]|nr:type II secretion system F family protein [Dehalococcoidia bacterium]